MTFEELVVELKKDLRNEITHMHFYLQSAALVQGLHAKEYKEFFSKEAAKEMQHVFEFSNMIVGLNEDIVNEPFFEKLPFLRNPINIIEHALTLEEEVVSNYCIRMHQAESLQTTDGDWISIFLENQIQDSRADVDELKQIIRGIRAGYQ